MGRSRYVITAPILKRLRFAKPAHRSDRERRFRQEGGHPEMVISDAVMRRRLDYLYCNPVKRGYVDLPEHWRYSGARSCAGAQGSIEIDPWHC